MSDFDPWNTTADPAQIRASANGLRSISGVLLGHGDTVGAVLSEVALSFSEIIAADVAAQIAGNSAALETAVEGTEYGYGVGTAWAEDVEAFRTARDALVARWNSAELDDFGAWPPVGLANAEPEMAEQMYANRNSVVGAAREAALRTYEAEGQRLWEEFQLQVDLRGRMFREGPTASNLSLLVTYLGWATMTLWPELGTTPVGGAEEGAAAGTTVVEGLDGTAGPEAVVEALSTVANITRRAAFGHELTSAEIDFLAAFYETLGQRVTEVPDYLTQPSFEYTTRVPQSEAGDEGPPIYDNYTAGGLDPAMVGALTAASANGMLVLSRNGPGGGGYHRLPTWARDALDGDEIQTQPLSPATSPPLIGMGSDVDQMGQLAEFLRHSTVEAGTGLSHQLATTTQDLIRLTADAEYFFLADTVDVLTAQVDSIGGSFLSVVARNEQACYDLLLDQDMPPDYDAGAFLLDVYCFEWSDDGASAAELTQFISRNAGSNDPAQQAMAAESMRALFDIVTEPGSPGFETLMDQVGTSGEAASSSLGQVNPEISAGFGSLMASYLDDFGLPEGSAGALGELTTEDRARFATLVMTAPAAAEDLVAAINEHNVEQLSGATDSITTAEYGMQAGRLLGLVDAAAVNVVMDQLGDELEDAAEDDKPSIIESVVNVTLGRLPGIGGAITEVLFDIAAGGDTENIRWPDLGEAISEDTERQYQVLAGLAQNLRDDNLLLTELDPRLLDESGAIRDLGELDMNGDAARAMLEVAIEEALGLEQGDLLQELDAGYQEVAGQLPSAPDVYENAVEG